MNRFKFSKQIISLILSGTMLLQQMQTGFVVKAEDGTETEEIQEIQQEIPPEEEIESEPTAAEENPSEELEPEEITESEWMPASEEVELYTVSESALTILYNGNEFGDGITANYGSSYTLGLSDPWSVSNVQFLYTTDPEGDWDVIGSEGSMTLALGVQYYIGVIYSENEQAKEILGYNYKLTVQKDTISTPEKAVWNGKTITWSGNGSQYKLYLYQNGSSEPIDVIETTALSVDLSSWMSQKGYGSYAASVQEIAQDTEHYNDSALSEVSESYVYHDETSPVISSYSVNAAHTALVAAASDNVQITHYAFTTDTSQPAWIETSAESFEYVPEQSGNYYFMVKDAWDNTAVSTVSVPVSSVVFNGIQKDTIYLVQGGSYTLPTDIEKTGYTFRAWQNTASEVITSVTAGDTAEQITVYAVFDLKPAEEAVFTKPSDYKAVYDGGEHTLTYVFTFDDPSFTSYQWYKGEVPLYGQNSLTLSVKDVSDSGEYHMTAWVQRPGEEGFSVTSDTVNVKITKADMHIEVDQPEPVTYGSPAPEYSYSYHEEDLKGSDTAADAFTAGILSCNYQQGDDVGSYPITAVDFTEGSNYKLVITNSELEVKSKTADVTAEFEDPDAVYTYNGEEITPAVIVKDGETQLREKVHYTLSYSDQVSAGTAKVTIRFIGNYAGSEEKELTYTIHKAEYTGLRVVFSEEDHKYEYDGSSAAEHVSLEGGTPEGAVTFIYRNSDGEIIEAPVNAGEYTVGAEVAESANYNSYSTEESLTFEITPVQLVLKSDSDEKEYDGSPLTKPGVTVEGSFVGSDDFQRLEATGTITSVGTQTNTISYVFSSSTVPENYTVTKEEGTLTITSKQLSAPGNVTWDMDQPGTASWVGVIKSSTDIEYRIILYKDGEQFSDVITTGNTSVDLSVYLKNADHIGSNFTFTVQAVPKSGSDYTASEVSECGNAISVHKLKVISNPVGVITFNMTESIMLSGESAALKIDSLSEGYSTDDATWTISTVTPEGSASVVSSNHTEATLTIGADNENAEIDVIASVSDDAPIINAYYAINKEDNLNAVFRMEAFDLSGIEAYAFSTNPVCPSDEEWQEAENTSTTVFTSDNITTAETPYYGYVRDVGGNITRTDRSLRVYRITIKPGSGTGTERVRFKGEDADGPIPLAAAAGFYKEGNKFVQWRSDVGKTYRDGATFTENVSTTLTAEWADRDFSYSVNFYLMNADGSYPDRVYKSLNLIGSYQLEVKPTDEQFKLNLRAYELDLERSFEAFTLTEDRSVPVSVYYKTKSFRAHYFYVNTDGELINIVQNYSYGQTVGNEPEKPSLTGYTFNGWNWQGFDEKPATMPAMDIYASGNLTADDTTYSIHYYFEGLDGNYVEDTESFPSIEQSAKHNSVVSSSVETVREAQGFTFAGVSTEVIESRESEGDSLSSENITGTVSVETPLTINYYYHRNIYTLKLNVTYLNRRETLYTESYQVKYGESVYTPEGGTAAEIRTIAEETDEKEAVWKAALSSADSYRLADYVDWSCGIEPQTMPAADVTVTREYISLFAHTYTIRVFAENAEGEYVRVQSMNYLTDNEYTPEQIYQNYKNRIWNDVIPGFANYHLNEDKTEKGMSNDSPYVNFYYERDTTPITIRYYYRDENGNDTLIGTAAASDKWGRTIEYNPFYYYYSDRPADTDERFTYTDGPAAGTVYNDEYCLVSYAGYCYTTAGNTWPGRTYSTKEDINKTVTGTFGLTKYYDGYLNVQNVTASYIDVYYSKVSAAQTYYVDVGYIDSRLVDQYGNSVGTNEFHQLTVRIGEQDYKVRIRNAADVLNAVSTGGSEYAAYKVLERIVGSETESIHYSQYGEPKSGYTAAEGCDGCYIGVEDGEYYFYVLDYNNRLYQGNRAGLRYSSLIPSTPGYDAVVNRLADYKEQYKEVYPASKGAYIEDNTYNSLINGNGRYVFTYNYAATLQIQYICEGEIITDPAVYVAKEITGLNKNVVNQFQQRNGYEINWYANADRTSRIGTLAENPQFEVTANMKLYGKYERGVYKNHTYVYYQTANEIEGLTDADHYLLPEVDLSTLESSTEERQDSVTYTDDYGQSQTVTRTVTRVTYRYNGEIVLVDDESVGVALTEKKLSEDEIHAYLDGLSGYQVDSKKLNTVTAGVPVNEGLTFRIYMAKDMLKLTIDHNDVLEGSGKKSVIEEKNIIAGQTIRVAEPQRAGYAFSGWTYYDNSDPEHPAKLEDAITTMPDYDLLMKAEWEPGEISISVVHYIEGIDGQYRVTDCNAMIGAEPSGTAAMTYKGSSYTALLYATGGASVEIDGNVYYFSTYDAQTMSVSHSDLIGIKGAVSADAESKITVAATKLELDHYTYKSTHYNSEISSGTVSSASAEIEVDASLQISNYYSRNQYEITTCSKMTTGEAADFETSGDGTYYYGSNVTLRVSLRLGYSLVGWTTGLASTASGSEDYDIVVEGNADYTALILEEAVPVPEVVVTDETTGTQAELELIYGYKQSSSTRLQCTVTLPEGTSSAVIIDSYQWYRKGEDGNWIIESGATAPSFNIPLNLPVGVYEYKCVVTTKNINTNKTISGEPAANFTVKVIPADLTPIVTNYTGVYDGNGHRISLSLGKNMDTSQFEVYYSQSELNEENYQSGQSSLSVVNVNRNSETSEVIPTTVYYYIHSKDGNYNDCAGQGNVLITPKTLAIKSSGAYSRPYDGTSTVNGSLTDTTTDKYKVSKAIMADVYGEVGHELDGYLVDFDAAYYNSSDVQTSHVSDARTIHLSNILLRKNDAAMTPNYNYSIADVNLAGEITPKMLTAEWSDTSLIYNAAQQGPTAVVSEGQLVAGDEVNVAVSGKQVNAGTYTAHGAIELRATVVGSEASDYQISNSAQTYEITRYAVIVRPTEQTIEYDGRSHTISDMETDTEYTDETLRSVLDIVAVSATPDGNGVNARNHTIGVVNNTVKLINTETNKNVTDNFTITYGTGILTITPKPVKISGLAANDKVYDGNRSATVRVTDDLMFDGMVSGDLLSINEGSVTGTFDTKDIGEQKEVALSYGENVLGGISAGNYTVDTEGSQQTSEASITGRYVDVIVQSASGVYGDEHTFEVTYEGIVETGAVPSGTITYTINGESFDHKLAASETAYTVEPDISGLSLSNYIFRIKENTQTTLTVSRRPVQIDGQSLVSREYDGTTNAEITQQHYVFHSIEGQSSGVVEGDTVSLTEYSASFDTKNAGTDKTVTVTDLQISNDNYLLANDKFEVVGEITKRPVTLMAQAKEISYGDSAPGYAVKAYYGHSDEPSGDEDPLADTDKEELLVTAGSNYDSTSAASRAVGSYPITVSYTENSNYDVKTIHNQLKVKQAVLTVTAVDETVIYGESRPTSHAYTIRGEKYSDTFDGLSAKVSYVYTGPEWEYLYWPAGDYAITPNISDTYGLNENYSYQTAAGTLTVTPRMVTVIKKEPVEKVYDGTTEAEILAKHYEITAIEGNEYSGIKPGDTVALSSDEGTYSTKNVSANNPVAVRDLALNNANYQLNVSELELDGAITQATLTVTAVNKEILYGQPLSAVTFTCDYAGFAEGESKDNSDVAGDPAYDLDREYETTDVKGTTFTITPKGLTSSNYAIQYVPGVLTVVANQLDAPAPVWNSAAPGTITWKKVEDISLTKVKEYIVELKKTGSTEVISTQTVTRDESDSYQIDFSAAIRAAKTGSYKVTVTAVPMNDNVTNSAGTSGALLASEVIVQYAADLITQAGKSSVVIHNAESYVLINGETADITGEMINSTGYNIKEITASPAQLTFDQIDETDKAFSTSVTAALTSASNTIVTVSLSEQPALINASLNIDPDVTRYTYDGREDYPIPEITVTTAKADGDNVGPEGYNYTYVFSYRIQGVWYTIDQLATDADNHRMLPKNIKATETIPVRVTVKASRKDNTLSNQIRLEGSIEVERAPVQLVIAQNDWTYGQSRNAIQIVKCTSLEGGETPEFTYKYKLTTDSEYTIGKPTEAGTYHVLAEASRTANYASAVSEPITVTIAQNKLAKITNLKMSASEAGKVPYGFYSWDKVENFCQPKTDGGLYENNHVDSASHVDVKYRVKYEYSTDGINWTVKYETTAANDLSSTNVDLSQYVTQQGRYRLSVTAISQSDNALDSDVYAGEETLPGPLVISGKVTAQTSSKMYDGTADVLTAELSGVTLNNPEYVWYKDGAQIAVTTGNTYDGAAVTNVGSGIYTCIIKDGGAEYYTTYTTVEITKRPVTLIADNKKAVYADETDENGAALGTLTYTDAGTYKLVAADVDGLGITLTPAVAINNKTPVGTYTIAIGYTASQANAVLRANYEITLQNGSYQIVPKSLGSGTVYNRVAAEAIEDHVYNGSAQKPGVVLTDTQNSETLVEGTDYTLSYQNNVNQGTAVITITGKGNYKDSITTSFVIQPKSINASTITLDTIADLVYDAQSHKIAPVVKDSARNTTLTADDYTVTYYDAQGQVITAAADFVDVQTISVLVTGKNNYKDDRAVMLTYSITKRPAAFTGESAEKTYDHSEHTLTIMSDAKGTDQGLVSGHTNSNVTYKAVGTEYGEYPGVFYNGTAEAAAEDMIILDAHGNDVTKNYEVTLTTGKLVIKKAEDNALTITGYDAVYDGQPHSIAVTAKYTSQNSDQDTVLYYAVKDPASGSFTEDDWSTENPSFRDYGTYTVYVKGVNPNYKDVLSSGIVNIQKKGVVISVDNSSKTYGDEDPAFTGQVSGLVDENDLVSVSYFRSNVSVNAAGTYPDVLSAVYTLKTEHADNYSVTIEKGDYTINRRTITVEWSDLAFTYDGHTHKPSAAVTNKTGTDEVNVNVGDVQTNAGSYTAVVKGLTGAQSANYQLPEDTLSTSFVINPRKVKVTADNKNKVYDNDPSVPVLSYTTGKVDGEGGLVNGDQLSNILITRESSEAAGKHVISVSQQPGSNPNYAITFVNGELEIGKRPITITVDDQEREYAEEEPVFTGRITAGTLVNANDLGTISYGRTTTQEAVGIYTDEITAIYTANADYSVTINKGTLTIKENTTRFTAAAEDVIKVFDGRGYGISVIAKLDGTVTDRAAVKYYDNTTGTYSLDVCPKQTEAGTKVIKYQVTLSGYVPVTSEASVTITPKPITVTADDGSKIYGENDPAEFTYTAQGVVDGYPLTNIAVSREAGENKGVYTITPSQPQSANPNYSITFKNGKFTIGTNTITVKAKPADKVYGENDPALTWVVEGMNRTETLNIRIKRTEGENAGEYAISVMDGEGGNPNYSITYVGSVFTIHPKEVTLTWGTDTFVYDGESHNPVLNVGGIVSGDTVEVQMSEPKTAANVYTAEVTGLDNDNYKLPETGTSHSLTITKAPVTIVVNAKEKIYSDEDPEFDAVITGEVNEEQVEVRYQRTAGEDVGKYDIIATAIETSSVNSNYQFTITNNQLEIKPKDISGGTVTLGAVVHGDGSRQTQEVEQVVIDDLIATFDVSGNTGIDPGTYVMTITGKGNFTGSIQLPWVITEEDSGGEEAGDISFEIIIQEGAPVTVVSASDSQIIRSVVTADDLSRVAAGEKLKIWIEITDINDTITAESKAILTELAGAYTIGTYFDISMWKEFNDDEQTRVKVTDTNNVIGLKVTLNDSLINKNSSYTREYIVLRNHNGAGAILETEYIDGEKAVVFETGLFSDYAIAYKDTRKPDPTPSDSGLPSEDVDKARRYVIPNTGDDEED